MDAYRIAPKDVESSRARAAVAQRILDTQTLPPPVGSFEPRESYPLAFDRNGNLAAVSFAVLDTYPEIADGWWCKVMLFVRTANGWLDAGGEHDNTTTRSPFERPAAVETGVHHWVHWHSNGGVAFWNEEPTSRHSFFGIAPTTTARHVVVDGEANERDLRITPWNGAYTAVIAGIYSRLSGYDHNGRLLGSFICEDHSEHNEQ